MSPWKLGGLSVIQLGKRVWREANEDEVFDRAAGLSYYLVFALFPALLFLTSLLGMLPAPDLMNRLMAYVEQAMPGDAASMIQKTLGEIVGGAKGSLLSIGALAALWAASGGIVAMMTAFSIAYDVEDSRPWWKRRVIAIGLTFALAVMMLSAAVLLVFGGTIGRFLGNTVGLGDLAVKVWNVAQWPLAVAFLVLGVALLYYAAPAVEHRTWYWVTPGSMVATVAWIAMSLGLRFYVSHFSNYTATYGSIAGVILLLLWLYLTGLVLLLGAEVNAEIEHAAAARGAATAKAKGERAPGVAGEPARHGAPDPEETVQERAAAAHARETANAPLMPDEGGHPAGSVGKTPSGAVVSALALPAVAWAGWWILSRMRSQRARRRMRAQRRRDRAA